METQELNDLLGEKIIEAIKDENMPMDRKFSRVEHLYNLGANLNVCDDKGHTPLEFSILNGYKEIAKFLIEKGADANEKYYYKGGWYFLTALIWASKGGYKEIVELLEKARKESKAKLKEELKEDSKFLRGSKDKKSNTNGGFWNRIFGGNDGM